MGLVIDFDVLRADPGTGESRLSQSSGKRGSAGDHILGDHRVPGVDPESRAKFRLVLGAGGLQAWELH